MFTQYMQRCFQFKCYYIHFSKIVIMCFRSFLSLVSMKYCILCTSFIYLKYIYITLYCTVYVFFTTCAIGIVKLRDNCITVVGGMRIIIHVQQWLLNLRRVLAVATRYHELVIYREYEKRLVVISVGQATITDFSHIS